MLIIVDINDLIEAVYAFDEQLPLLTSRFKFIFDQDSVMVMFSVKSDAIHAEKLLTMVLARFLIAIEDLDASSVAFALDIVSDCPFVDN